MLKPTQPKTSVVSLHTLCGQEEASWIGEVPSPDAGLHMLKRLISRHHIFPIWKALALYVTKIYSTTRWRSNSEKFTVP